MIRTIRDLQVNFISKGLAYIRSNGLWGLSPWEQSHRIILCLSFLPYPSFNCVCFSHFSNLIFICMIDWKSCILEHLVIEFSILLPRFSLIVLCISSDLLLSFYCSSRTSSSRSSLLCYMIEIPSVRCLFFIPLLLDILSCLRFCLISKC